RNTVQLNAYDNRKTARENVTKGSFTLPANCVNCDDEGTGDNGVWSIAENSPCGGGSFSNPNDPDAIFTAEAGTYTLNWSVAGCTSSITVTTTNCDQIDFDGNNDYVDYGPDNFNLNSGAFSIEAWVKPEVISGKQTIFSKRNSNGSNTSGYDLSIDNSGIVSFNTNQSGTITSSPYKITTNRWYHIAVTRDASGKYRLYIDGIEIKSNTSASPSSNSFKAILGAMDDNSSNNGPKKHFKGWIDEFRVWNVGLTAEQIHLMMNQKLVSSPTVSGNVQGEIIPSDINGLSWSNLTAYFQMEPAQVACGYLMSTSSAIKGKLKNISSNETQTAPIPYTSAVNGQWDADNTWTYPDVWDVPNSVGINGSKIDWNIVRTNHNISSTRDVTLLGLMVDANKLTITGPGVQDETNPGSGLWVTHYLKLLGNIDLVGESQLVQKRYIPSQFSDSFLDPASTGFLERDQQGTADLFTYNYWSSPVGVRNPTTNNNSYTVRDILRDGGNPINWLTSGYNGTNTNPIGIADYWIWKFANRQDDNYSLWQHIRSTGSMLAGEGFTMKGPGTGPISANQNYVFTGKPNNGNINLTLAGGNDYLVGNPYPSALDGVQFILDNGPVIAGKAPGITGTLYFWEHWGGGSHVLSEYQGGYATFNLSGGAPSAAKGSNDPDVGTGGIPTKIPGKFIPVSQGFFVVAEGNGGTIQFNNGQRIFKRENANSVFLRTAEGASTTNYSPDGEDPRMKFRIGFNSTNTIHRQLLLTVDENATEGIDWGYDALNIDDQIDDMFWMIGDGKYNIQGIDAINETSIIPLGFHLKNAGQNNISIDKLENTPDNIEIYVHDKVTKTYHDLRQSTFNFNLPGGDYLDRYEIVFKDPTALGLSEKEFSQLDIHYTIDLESLILLNPTLEKVKSIELFNILGQSVYSTKKIENATYSEYKVKNLKTGTYIVKMITEMGSISKKVLVK
ncbi:MAG: LamG-like jellyroll fold domain-containing protein, partial [Aquaticitalea sp.]